MVLCEGSDPEINSFAKRHLLPSSRRKNREIFYSRVEALNKMACQIVLPLGIEYQPARPFLKWAGGKTKLVPILSDLAPKSYNRYFEPFLGGGAFFFRMRPDSAILNDLNSELIDCYRCVRDRPEELFHTLQRMKVGEEAFYEWRKRRPSELTPLESAARFIYLNKTCFNGLYRVNKKGEFNSPFGGYTSVALADLKNLLACAELLSNATLSSVDYKSALSIAGPGDFVYLDPPYVPVGKFSDFKRYTAQPFGSDEQRQLALLFRELDKRGCYLLLSNSKHRDVEELYGGYKQHTVSMPRFVNCKGNKRGGVEELIVTNYEYDC